MKRKKDERSAVVVDLHSARQTLHVRPRNAREKELLALFQQLPPGAKKEFMTYVEALYSQHNEEQVTKGRKVLKFHRSARTKIQD